MTAVGKWCPRCGAEYIEGWGDCSNCGVPLVDKGVPCGDAAVDQARIEMKAREVSIGFDLASGDASAEMLTCDLTPGYVTFNAEYEL